MSVAAEMESDILYWLSKAKTTEEKALLVGLFSDLLSSINASDDSVKYIMKQIKDSDNSLAAHPNWPRILEVHGFNVSDI